MNVGLTIGAVVMGLVVMLLFLSQPLKVKVKFFCLAILLGIAMAGFRLTLDYSGGIIDSLFNPPSWKLLAIAASAIGLGASILWTLLVSNRRTRKK